MNEQRPSDPVTPAQAHIKSECDRLASLLIAKHADYRGSAWKEPVLKPSMSAGDAILVRMSDKIERIANLLDGNKPLADESLRDTIRDLAGYCVLLLAMPIRTESDRCTTPS